MARDGLAEPDARARIRSQMPIEKKKTLAAFVIDNSGSLDRTRAQADAIYRQLAAKSTVQGASA
jgi:dephospho-CoA kinase